MSETVRYRGLVTLDHIHLYRKLPNMRDRQRRISRTVEVTHDHQNLRLIILETVRDTGLVVVVQWTT